jgi:plasmid stability protein
VAAKHLTIRDMPDDLVHALVAETQRRGEPMDRAVIDLLRQALGVGVVPGHDNGLERLAGTWSAEDLSGFEDATRCFETIDEDIWR